MRRATALGQGFVLLTSKNLKNTAVCKDIINILELTSFFFGGGAVAWKPCDVCDCSSDIERLRAIMCKDLRSVNGNRVGFMAAGC